MATIQTVTIGSGTFSVYALTSDPVADLTNYFGAQLGANADAVAAASSTDKKRALVMAAGWIDRAVTFSGSQTVDGQPRQWPRTGASCGTKAIADGTTPDNVANAEFELAGIILVDPSQSASMGTGSNIKAVKAGTASVDFFTPTIGTATDSRLPIVANDLLKCMYGSTNIQAPVIPGTDQDSHFTEDDFERGTPFS